MDDRAAAATKEGIVMIMGEIGKLYDASERWKNEILEANKEWKEERKRHVDFTVKHRRYDRQGAHRDDLEQIKDTGKKNDQRITRLEKHAGLAAYCSEGC